MGEREREREREDKKNKERVWGRERGDKPSGGVRDA